MPARILVIDDDLASLELMTYLLQAFGHTLLCAGNGEEGLEAIGREGQPFQGADIFW
jgi:CheY-like chemotaxis protein